MATAEQSQALWQAPDNGRLRGKRDRALLAVLLACGLRRHEAVALTFNLLQQREDHWAIVDLAGKLFGFLVELDESWNLGKDEKR